jgi:hypothetical protein
MQRILRQKRRTLRSEREERADPMAGCVRRDVFVLEIEDLLNRIDELIG